MERLYVEVRSERAGGFEAQLAQVQRTDAIRKRLCGICDHPIQLGRRLPGREYSVGQEVVERLLASPALGVHASIDDHARSPQQLGGSGAKRARASDIDTQLPT